MKTYKLQKLLKEKSRVVFESESLMSILNYYNDRIVKGQQFVYELPYVLTGIRLKSLGSKYDYMITTHYNNIIVSPDLKEDLNIITEYQNLPF